MMFKNNNKLAFVLSLIALAGVTLQAGARPNINSSLRTNDGNKGGQLKTTASCKPAEASIDLDINNVRARLMTGGDMWWDNGTSEARYEVPKGTKKNSLFAGSVWIGGFDAQRQLKVAAQTYRQSGNDYWPGPLDDNAEIDAATCSEWDKMWKINKETINRFRELTDYSGALDNPDYEVIKQWPAKGNQYAIGRNQNNLDIPSDKDYAPFKNVAGNDTYEPNLGDYPDITGDQYIWWVFNDKGNVKGESSTPGIGVEVQASAFAFSTKDFLNDATFYNYRLINRGNLTLDSTYIATWTDADLGYYKDDYIGCDTTRGLGILYNGKSIDGQGEINSYGDKVPMVAVDFFKGPKKTYRPAGATKDTTVTLKMEAFTYYNNDFSIIGNPRNGNHIYNYMTGSIINGERFTNDFSGPNINSKGYGSGPITKYVFTGDPGVKSEWSECTCNNPVDDRRFVHSSGPFKLEPGVVNDITIGAVWVADVGGCPSTSFRKIRAADDLAQSLFNNNFETVEGPEAPRMVVREMDRKLVFYLLNDEISNNEGERFGRDTAKKFRVNAVTTKPYKIADSLYKFEGYRVFQLKNSEVQPAQIFNDKGELNTDVAVEVFQCDVKNGVSRIVNYEKNTDISDSTWIPVVKVNGNDSGIRHSFEVTIDQFATTDNKRLVNYRNYYFVAIAYAYNEFYPFTLSNTDSSQDKPYIESAKGAGGAPIPVVAGMPNPANGGMGTVLNSDYGDGVKITRLEGKGNGGNSLSMTDSSELEAISGPDYKALHPVYKPNEGPVGVKVVDPVKVKPHDWELYLEGTTNPAEPTKGLTNTTTWKLVDLTNNAVIYGEHYVNETLNEQILENYGISVTLQQVVRPGDDQVNGNGYLGSSIIYSDPSKPWLVGVKDAEARDFRNWIRSGGVTTDTFSKCNFNDLSYDTSGQFYESMLDNYTSTTGTWAPYTLGSDEKRSYCGFGVVKPGTYPGLSNLPSVDIVFTSDKSKWTRSVVLEMQDVAELAQGSAGKFDLRSHQSWNLDVDGEGRPVYSTIPGDTGMSWFPGYAVNQETGERLNIIFSEDSWLKAYNGADMIWNPTTEDIVFDQAGFANKIFGGKHYIYILGSKYDECAQFKKDITSGSIIARTNAYKQFQWVGMPLLNDGFHLTSFEQGFIPTETRLRFRVQRPYASYPEGETSRNGGNPMYSFSTKNLAPVELYENPNADKDALLDKIHAVPNPYYGYVGYEINRLDTRVRIINLPRRATVNVYSLDGSLISRIEKDNPNVSYVDWNLRNTKGLPVASGMYLIHVQAEGIGEKVIRWFGAMRPLDITTY